MAYMNFFRYSAAREPPMNCKITLTPEKSSYNPGDTIKGKLTVSHQKDLYCLGFKVILEGRALVKFKEREIIQSKTVALLETHVYVCGGKGDLRMRLHPAEHSFPFEIALPKTALPGSFKSPYGLVLYQIVASLQSDEWRTVKKAEKTITVNAYVNLNRIAEASLPLNLVKTEKTSILPSLSRRTTPQFKFLLKLAQAGFLPGEEIPFMLELDNPNAHEIRNMSVTLVLRITYHAATSSWKTTNTVLAATETSAMDSPYGTVWTGSLSIPATQVPTQAKGIIEQHYILKVEVSTNGQVSPLRGEIPIIMGTVRISRSAGNASPVDPPHRNSLGDSSTSYSVFRSRSPITFTGALLGNLGPPSYSTLSLRTRSSSIETLPPDYSEAILEDQDCRINLDTDWLRPPSPEADDVAKETEDADAETKLLLLDVNDGNGN